MGSSNSSADEWIELYNNGNEVDLTGYVIESESKKISIKLSGLIANKAYYLIERTDENSVPNVVADLIATFGNGLSNAGDNLYLKNSDGQIVDSLNFSSGWPAGDNITKQTMQLVSGSWLTAEATPKKAPIGAQQQGDQSNNSDSNESGNANQNTNSSSTQKSGGSSYVAPKNLSRFLINLGEEQLSQIPVNIEVDYRDDYGNKPSYGFYRVSFGDGIEKDFKLNEPISHIYEYKGDYKISVKFLESVWSIVPKKQASINVSINEPVIDIDINHAPILVVKNKSTKDIDLSNFNFVSSYSSVKSFNPPSGSVVFAGKEVWISPKVTGFVLEDFNSFKVLSKADGYVVYTLGNDKTVVKSVTEKNKIAKAINLVNQNINKPTELVQDNIKNDDLVASTVSSDFAKQQKPNNLITWFLFGALVIAGSFVFIKLRKTEVEKANEFSLLEE
jgi:hypothetical protein